MWLIVCKSCVEFVSFWGFISQTGRDLPIVGDARRKKDHFLGTWVSYLHLPGRLEYRSFVCVCVLVVDVISCSKVDPWSRWVTGPQQPRQLQKRENPHLHEPQALSPGLWLLLGRCFGFSKKTSRDDWKVMRKLCSGANELRHVRWSKPIQ